MFNVCMYRPLNTQTWRAKWHEMGDLGKDARDVPRRIQGQHDEDARDAPAATQASVAVVKEGMGSAMMNE